MSRFVNQSRSWVKKVTDRIPQKLGLKRITRNDPEYWGLAGVLTDEEAELAIKLGGQKTQNTSGNCEAFRTGSQEM